MCCIISLLSKASTFCLVPHFQDNHGSRPLHNNTPVTVSCFGIVWFILFSLLNKLIELTYIVSSDPIYDKIWHTETQIFLELVHIVFKIYRETFYWRIPWLIMHREGSHLESGSNHNGSWSYVTPCFSRCGLWTSSISITWRTVRNAESWASSHNYCISLLFFKRYYHKRITAMVLNPDYISDFLGK